jgi:pyridoxine kinase
MTVLMMCLEKWRSFDTYPKAYVPPSFRARIARMNILSIQSEVAYGHVGQGAARFALQRLGAEVWAVPTVLLSGHAARPAVAGEPVAADLMGRLIGGLEANGWFAGCDAVLSGYLGHADQAAIVGDAVRQVRRANPQAIYCLDPVFGDSGRAYAKRGVAEAMAKTLLPLADIVTPNAFELSSLSSVPVRNPEEALEAARRLGRPIVLATSIPDGAERIGTLALGEAAAWFASTPLLDGVPHGAGDLLAALFLARHLMGGGLESALAQAVASVFHLLRRAVCEGLDEMPLIAGQEALSAPPRLEKALQLRRLA